MLAAENDSSSALPAATTDPARPGSGIESAIDSEHPSDVALPSGGQFSTPENMIIPLWPLTLIFLCLALVGGAMLWRERWMIGAPEGPATSP